MHAFILSYTSLYTYLQCSVYHTSTQSWHYLRIHHHTTADFTQVHVQLVIHGTLFTLIYKQNESIDSKYAQICAPKKANTSITFEQTRLNNQLQCQYLRRTHVHGLHVVHRATQLGIRDQFLDNVSEEFQLAWWKTAKILISVFFGNFFRCFHDDAYKAPVCVCACVGNVCMLGYVIYVRHVCDVRARRHTHVCVLRIHAHIHIHTHTHTYATAWHIPQDTPRKKKKNVCYNSHACN